MSVQMGIPGASTAEPTARTWREVWQLPALAVAGLLLLTAVVWAFATRPQADMATEFRRADRQIQSGEYARALDTLGERVLPVLNKGGLSRPQERGFFLMRARALYLGQREAGVSRSENDEAIVCEYEQAQKLGAELQPADLVYLGEALLALGRVDEAAAKASAIPDADRVKRMGLLKHCIEASLENARYHELALSLLTTMSGDAELNSQERLWALSRQARLLLAQGFYNDATTKILRTLPRIIDDAEPTLRGEVQVTLARSYIAEGELSEASAQLKAAVDLLGEAHPLAAEIMMLQGQVEQELERFDAARDRFSRVVEEFKNSRWNSEALLGLAEVEAAVSVRDPRRGAPDIAIERYMMLVERLHDKSQKQHLAPERVQESLMARYQEQFEAQDYRTALRFITLAERVADLGAPPAMLLGLAECRKRIAEVMLREAGGRGVLSLAQADPTTQREARELLLSAGDYYKRHAGRVVQTDPRGYADSLWNAADCLDRAGDTDGSIRAFQQFVADFPGDTRFPEAKYRLGDAFRAQGELKLAARTFADLIIDRDGSGRAGPFADASYVPLAQTLLADDDMSNDAEAERLLNEVLSGRLGGTGTVRYREALRELADLYYRTGRFEAAIERFEEYLQRLHEEPAKDALAGEHAAIGADEVSITYRLADSYRLSARAIEKALEGALPERDARAMRKTRTDRLSKAGRLYQKVIAVLDEQPHRAVVHDLYLRNSFFYLGDCDFDMANYDVAVRHYDAARERYPKDPAALVAMTQIVSAYLEQGQREKAEVANVRARRFYESLPESVWDDPTLPMSRREWERWLGSQSRLASVTQE